MMARRQADWLAHRSDDRLEDESLDSLKNEPMHWLKSDLVVKTTNNDNNGKKCYLAS